VRLVPKDSGELGESGLEASCGSSPGSRDQIIQAEPLGMIHSMHPMAVPRSRPAFGHDFMSVSMHDMIGPFQDMHELARQQPDGERPQLRLTTTFIGRPCARGHQRHQLRARSAASSG
jgi:hypothetical protein